MTALSRTDLAALLADAQTAHEQMVEIGEKVLANPQSTWLRRRAAVLAVQAADYIPRLVDALAHKSAEADTAHQHFVDTCRSDWKNRAAEAHLLAELDQVRAATRDCSCGSTA